MPLPGKNATVTLEHLTQSRGPHGDSADGQPDQTYPDLDAVIARPSSANLWRITVEGDHSAIASAPGEWRITDTRGNVFGCTKATYRPPIERIGESEHTLIFAQLHGEVGEEADR